MEGRHAPALTACRLLHYHSFLDLVFPRFLIIFNSPGYLSVTLLGSKKLFGHWCSLYWIWSLLFPGEEVFSVRCPSSDSLPLMLLSLPPPPHHLATENSGRCRYHLYLHLHLSLHPGPVAEAWEDSHPLTEVLFPEAEADS